MQTYVLGVDPSAKCTGWALLAACRGEYDLAAYGAFSPDKLAAHDIDSRHSRFERAAEAVTELVAKYGLDRHNTVAGVEHAAIGLISARSMEVVLSAVMSAKIALSLQGIAVRSVYPASWQALIRIKGYDSKECSDLMVRDVYGVTGLSEDICDAVAIAHWTAIMSNEKPYLGDIYRKLEEGVADESLYKLGRKLVDELYRKRYNSELPKKERHAVSKAFVAACETYRDNLEKFRKAEGLAPQTKVRIDGNSRPKSSEQTEEWMRKAKSIFEAGDG